MRRDQQGWTINWEHTFGNFQVRRSTASRRLKDCARRSGGNLSCGGTKAAAT
jgi:hypothetical protein